MRLRIAPAAARRRTAAGEAPVELDVTFEHLEHARQEVLQLGPQVDVLAPEELRHRTVAEAQALVTRYGAV